MVAYCTKKEFGFIYDVCFVIICSSSVIVVFFCASSVMVACSGYLRIYFCMIFTELFQKN